MEAGLRERSLLDPERALFDTPLHDHEAPDDSRFPLKTDNDHVRLRVEGLPDIGG